MSRVHPSAVVDPSAKLAEDVVVGPLAFIGAGVELDAGVVVDHHGSVEGRTRVGPRTRIFPFAAIGGEPQDKKFDGESTRLQIGCDNVIREHVTIHVGTHGGGGCTSIGDDNLIMNSAHIGHDVRIGSHCIVAEDPLGAVGVGIEEVVTLAFVGEAHRIEGLLVCNLPRLLPINSIDDVSQNSPRERSPQ